MRVAWADVLEAVRTTLVGVGDLVALLPASRIRQVDAGEFVVPSIEMTMLADTEQELVDVVTLQFDLWFDDWENLLEAERLVRKHVSSSLPMKLGDMPPMWALYRGGRVLGPPDDGLYNRSFDIQYQPIRTAGSRYRG